MIRNILDPLIVYFTLDIGTVLVMFSTIAFVGDREQVPRLHARMGQRCSPSTRVSAPDPAVDWSSPPVLAVFVTVLAFSLLGDGLRDILDPRTRRAMVRGSPVAGAPCRPPNRSTYPLPPVATPEVA